MGTEVLLTSEAFVKEVCSISENVAGQYIRPSIREAQDVNYREILGDALLERLVELVATGGIEAPENEAYKTLLDRSQQFLANTACVGIAQRVTLKIANAGVVQTPDEKVQVASQPDMAKVQYFYQSKADSLAYKLERFVLQNKASYPELQECDCLKMRAHLRTAATCGIFLGGARGRFLPGIPLNPRKK